MASKKLTKRDLRDDAFRDILADGYRTISMSLENYWYWYLGVLGGALLLLILGYTYWTMQQGKTEHASLLIGEIQETFNAPIQETPNEANPLQKTFKTTEARGEELLALATQLEETGGSGKNRTVAEVYSILEAAREGDVDQAILELEPLTKDPRVGTVALRLRAFLYEDKNQFDKAEQDWIKLSEIKTELLPAGTGYWMLGQFYERQEDTEKAVAAYEKGEAALAAAEDDDALKSRITSQIATLKGEE